MMLKKKGLNFSPQHQIGETRLKLFGATLNHLNFTVNLILPQKIEVLTSGAEKRIRQDFLVKLLLGLRNQMLQ